jgi:hypothetical protein
MALFLGCDHAVPQSILFIVLCRTIRGILAIGMRRRLWGIGCVRVEFLEWVESIQDY